MLPPQRGAYGARTRIPVEGKRKLAGTMLTNLARFRVRAPDRSAACMYDKTQNPELR